MILPLYMTLIGGTIIKHSRINVLGMQSLQRMRKSFFPEKHSVSGVSCIECLCEYLDGHDVRIFALQMLNIIMMQ